MDRERLYARIDARVDEMLAAGAEDEVRRANAAGASLTARKALGFEELLVGDADGMKRRTRNYARRQLTWMRKLSGIETIDTTGRSEDEIAARIVELWVAGAGPRAAASAGRRSRRRSAPSLPRPRSAAAGAENRVTSHAAAAYSPGITTTM